MVLLFAILPDDGFAPTACCPPVYRAYGVARHVLTQTLKLQALPPPADVLLTCSAGNAFKGYAAGKFFVIRIGAAFGDDRRYGFISPKAQLRVQKEVYAGKLPEAPFAGNYIVLKNKFSLG